MTSYKENTTTAGLSVPFFRPELNDAEIAEVVDTLKSGWLTTGPKVRRFEEEFAAAVGARQAVAVNSCTAALHLALEALNVQPGDVVLVPTMTFAATAEVVRYCGAIPLLVDCDPVTLNIDLDDAREKLQAIKNGSERIPATVFGRVVGIIPVHVGGLMVAPTILHDFAAEHDLWMVEDAAHAFPAAWREGESSPWVRCGENTSRVTCFSFYANKTITTGEGGMAVTDDGEIAERLRMMSLHGLSRGAWDRYTAAGSWDYAIMAPGFKYNLTDLAAAIGIHQLARAEEMRVRREEIAREYTARFEALDELELPPSPDDRIHSWHLYPIRLRLDTLSIDRNEFIEELKRNGVMCSVHWRPLHLHPYYREVFDWKPSDLPHATNVWSRLVSLPLFPSMRQEEIDHVIETVTELCARFRVRPATVGR